MEEGGWLAAGMPSKKACGHRAGEWRGGQPGTCRGLLEGETGREPGKMETEQMGGWVQTEWHVLWGTLDRDVLHFNQPGMLL